jgi:hypothetical protein
MAKERGWHCAYTHSCLFESVSAPVRIPGTSLITCAPHASQMQLSRFRGGRESAESVAGMARVTAGKHEGGV